MQPFDDIDVLDLTQSVAGPTATQLLGAMGANVVKVEPPEGDAFRDLLNGSFFSAVNMGGKRSIALDLKSDEGVEIARELAESADVVIESFRPGVVDRFGLDYESVSAANEDVIYCSVTGFGQDGPRADWPAYDPVIQAVSSLMSTIGYPDRPPVRIGASVIDCATGVTAAFATVSALYDRRESGEGEYIDVNLFEVAVSWMGYWIANYSATGEVPERSGQGFAGLAPNEVFHAAEEEPFYLACANDRLYGRLCRAVDREELADDERFSESDQRWENREELREELSETFTQYDRSELMEILTDAGVPVGPLQTIDELVEEDPHVESRGLLTDSYNPLLDREVETATVPFRTTDGRPDLSETPPELGEHTRAVLSELGYSEERIDRMLAAGAVRES